MYKDSQSYAWNWKNSKRRTIFLAIWVLNYFSLNLILFIFLKTDYKTSENVLDNSHFKRLDQNVEVR